MTSIIINGANGKMGKKLAEIINSNPSKFKIVLGIDSNSVSKNCDFKIEKNFPEDVNADVIIDFDRNALIVAFVFFGLEFGFRDESVGDGHVEGSFVLERHDFFSFFEGWLD